jgi:hypothetical protein
MVSSMALAQSQSQQPQPPDPTAQAPDSKAPSPKASTTGSHPQAERSETFVGEIILSDGSYYLRSGDAQYKLDDQVKGKQMAGQTVQVTGSVQNNVLHVKSIAIH